MRAIAAFYFLFLIFGAIKGQGDEYVTETNVKVIKLCSACTCSEIPDVDGTHLVFNIQCSELDKIEDIADLDKIEWPENPNQLKIAATFEGLGISTLGKLPPNSQVETLQFTSNAIKTYWPDPFSDVPSLKKLSFAQNDLALLTPDLFTNIERLEDLDLSYNKLSEFNPLDFKPLTHVRRLNLQSNLLKKVPVDALHPMVMLEDLDLGKNGIHDLLLKRTESVVVRGLKRLNLSGNRIRIVALDSFPNNNSLELLDLSNNIIEVIEADAFMTCTNLRELNLAQNNITFSFSLPPYLQIVILKVNTLYHWLKFPKGITYIDMSYNRLSDIFDESLVYFDHLEVLNIGGNQIKEFHIEKKLPKLFSLDLSYNFLKEVPKSLNSQNLPNLEELRLDGNPMSSIYFKSILALRTLYMNELNKLSVVDDKAFSNVVGKSIEEGKGQKECFSLYMSNCPSLTDIKDGAFDGTSLCMLDISKNNLTRLSRNLVSWRSIADGVNLQWNPWHCGCDLQWVLADLLPLMYQKNSMLLIEFRCASPRAFEGLRLVHFYNWTDDAMCSGSPLRDNYMLAPSTSGQPQVTYLTYILGGSIILGLIIAISLFIYLIKTRKQYRVRRAALKRKRQSAIDARNSSGTQKDQFTVLNKL